VAERLVGNCRRDLLDHGVTGKHLLEEERLRTPFSFRIAVTVSRAARKRRGMIRSSASFGRAESAWAESWRGAATKTSTARIHGGLQRL
jgi:hypothetical protein